MKTITLTERRIIACKTLRGGYTKRALALFGVAWPPLSGWKDKIRGTQITVQAYREAKSEGSR